MMSDVSIGATLIIATRELTPRLSYPIHLLLFRYCHNLPVSNFVLQLIRICVDNIHQQHWLEIERRGLLDWPRQPKFHVRWDRRSSSYGRGSR